MQLEFCPFNDAIFNDSDFITSEMSNKIQKLIFFESQFGEEEQRRIVIVDGVDYFDLAATETVSTSDESTPGPSRPSSAASHAFNEARAASKSRVEGYVALLDDIGPVQNAPKKQKSNRGPKPGKTTILTSPENVTMLKEKQL